LASEPSRARFAVCAVLFGVATLLASPARAQPAQPDPREVDDDTRNSARKLGEEGNRLFSEGDFATALDRYQRAEALVNVPTLGVRIARCLGKLGRLVEATEKYVQVARTELPETALPQHVEAVAQARAELADLKPKVPSVIIRVEPADGKVEVSIDGKPVPPALLGASRSVDPGKHVVVAQREGRVAKQTFDIGEGQTRQITLRVDAPTAEGGATDVENGLRLGGIAALAAGGASLVAFGVTGGLALSKRSELEASCGAELRCGTSFHDDADAYNRLRLASTATLWIGAGLAATGAALVIAAPAASSRTEIGLGVGPGALVFGGTF
jgi:hypothetical protein